MKHAFGCVGGGLSAGGTKLVINLKDQGEISKDDLRKFFLSKDGGGYSEMCVSVFFDDLWAFFEGKKVLNKKKNIVTLSEKLIGDLPLIRDYNLRNDLI